MEILYAAYVVVHFCATINAAPPLAPPSLHLLDNPNVNLTVPFSFIQPYSPNGLPSDPFLYHVPSSDETVRFYDYRRALPRRQVIHAIVLATRAIAMHGSSDEPIPDGILRYGAGDVYLLAHHSGRMTWRVWEAALQGLAEFLEKYEYVDMEFDIGQAGVKQYFGTGVLGLKKR